MNKTIKLKADLSHSKYKT